jgi:hypothetical protein
MLLCVGITARKVNHLRHLLSRLRTIENVRGVIPLQLSSGFLFQTDEGLSTNLQ